MFDVIRLKTVPHFLSGNICREILTFLEEILWQSLVN